MLIIVVAWQWAPLASKKCHSTPLDAEELRPFSASIFTRLGIGILEVYPLLPSYVDVEILVLVLTVPGIPDQMYVRRAFIERALELLDYQ